MTDRADRHMPTTPRQRGGRPKPKILRLSVMVLLLASASQLATGIRSSAATEIRLTPPACGAAFMPSDTTGTPIAQQAGPSDLIFLDAMIQQDAEAIGLAGLALQYAQDARVKRIGLRVAESQATEIQLLRTWRLAWFPGEPPATDQAPVALGTACVPQQFDRQFLEQLLANFQTSIELATAAQQEADHDELRQFSGNVIRARTGEIASIRAVLRELGDVPAGSPPAA